MGFFYTQKMTYQVKFEEILGDQFTPVGLYSRLRDHYPGAFLLECSDYHRRDQSFSIIGLQSLQQLKIDQRDQEFESNDYQKEIGAFMNQFEILDCPEALQPFCGIYGYTSFEAVQLMEEVDYPKTFFKDETPLLEYHLFQFTLVFDHFRDVLYLIELVPDGSESELDSLKVHLRQTMFADFHFETKGEIRSNMTDEAYQGMVSKAIKHVERGDVFQVVVSRAYLQDYQGDEFMVYRSLRTINPSPYLFYFDLGHSVIMGSSPEAHLITTPQHAEIHPIAGTYPRTGNDELDAQKAQALALDPKEQSEHTMLVDLARNDLNKYCEEVQVVTRQETQFFSHVIHLVSKVKGKLLSDSNTLDLFSGSFPAGTLSGAPKHRALQIIQDLEPEARGAYGGAIGVFGFFGHSQHAIIIRSFIAKDQTLRYQAGAGIVLDSDPKKEMEEVLHKLGALSKSLKKQQYANVGH